MSINELIEKKESELHNTRLLAKTMIPRGILLLTDTGVHMTHAEADRLDREKTARGRTTGKSHVYRFYVNTVYDLDVDFLDNDGRYIQHSCDPNCAFRILGNVVEYTSARDIMKGEELTIGYRFGIDDDNPYEFMNHPCNCGSKNCFGYILDKSEWEKARRLLEKLDRTS